MKKPQLKFSADCSEAQIIFGNESESFYFSTINGDLFKAIDECVKKRKISRMKFLKKSLNQS